MKTRKFIPVILACILFMSSCNKASIDPLVNLENRNLNNQVKLSMVIPWNTFRRSDQTSINIESHSEELITFPYNLGLRIFVKQGDEWMEVEENENWQDKGNIVLIPTDVIYYSFMGDFPDTEEELFIRVYVLGWIDDENNSVGAYIEMKLE